MRRTHRCQEPWDEHPLWEFRYDFATTKPPTGPTVERSNEYVTYLAPPSGAGPIYFTHFHFINAYGKPSTITRASLVRAFEHLVSRYDWVANTVGDLDRIMKHTGDGGGREEATQLNEKITLGFVRTILILPWAVGLHLNFLADAERNAEPPRSWTSYPFSINAEELSRPSTPWSKARQWLYGAGTISNFAFLVAEYVNKYGLPFIPEMEKTLQRVHTLHEQYLQRVERGASLAATSVPLSEPPPYSVVEPEEIWFCGLCGEELE